MGIELTRIWSRRPLNRPWEGVGIPDAAGPPDTIFISVRGSTTIQNLTNPNDYYSTASKHIAAAKILDYYGKNDLTPPLENDLQNVAYNFTGTPQERVVLMYSVELWRVRDAPCKTIFTQISSYSQEYPVATFQKKIDAMSAMFERFQDQYKFFAGRTTPPISFIRIYNRIRLAHEKIVEFIEFNGLTYRDSEDDVIQINFDTNYKIDNIIVTQNGLEKHLVKGNIYYFEDLDRLRSSRTNKLLYNLEAIYSLRNQKSTWTDFIEEYIENVTVNYFGLAMTPEVGETIAKGSEEENKLFTSIERGYEIQAVMEDPDNQARMINEALSETQITIQEKLSKVAEKMKDIDKGIHKVQAIINQFGINHLIEAALECLAIKTGVPMDALPMVLPGVGFSPWEIPKPAVSITIPKMYPLPLPKLDISQAITDAIKEGLKEAGIAAVVGMAQTLAEIIVELCSEQDQNLIGEGPDIPSIINDYPNPKEIISPEAGDPFLTMDKYRACLDDYGLDELEANTFMMKLSQNISPQQTCNLINGDPSGTTFERIYNIIREDPYLITLKSAFLGVNASGIEYPLHNEIIEFFLCLGGLISPEFCAAVYEPPINSFPENIELCDLEEMLVDRIDNDTFNELLDAYNNLDSLPDDLAANPPNMTPGCGIVPPLTEMPALHFAIRKLFRTLIEAPKRAFVEDITGLKTILLVPQPGASAKNAELLEKLDELPCADPLDPAACPPGSTGAYPTPGPEPQTPDEFLQNMFGPAAPYLNSIPGVTMMQDVVNNATSYDRSSLQSNIHYDVNPVYKEEMSNIDSRVVVGDGTWSRWGALSHATWPRDHAYFSLHVGDKRTYYSPGGPPGANSLLIFGEAESGNIAGSASEILRTSAYRDSRDAAASLFNDVVFGQLTELYGPGLVVDSNGNPAVNTSISVLAGASRNYLWFEANLSVFNSLAYNLQKSRLFDEEEFRKLILSPRRCQDGGSYGDLSGFDEIMKKATDDFYDNASQCPDDQICSMGPVEDSLIYGITSAYVQILVLEQLLKNIWLLDTYGLGAYAAQQNLSDIIISNINRDLAGDGSVSTWLLQRDSLYAGATFHVDKLRQQSVLLGTSNQIPDPAATTGTITIPGAGSASGDIAGWMKFNSQANFKRLLEGSATNHAQAAKVGQWCLEYMIKLRIFEMQAVINDVFGTDSSLDFRDRFLHYGLPEVNVLDDVLSSPEITVGFKTTDTITNAIEIQLTDLANASQVADGVINPAANDRLFWDYTHNGFSNDEAISARENGILAIEKYGTFDFDFNYYLRLKASINSTDVAMVSALDPHINALLGNTDLGVGGKYLPYDNGMNGPSDAGLAFAQIGAPSTFTVSLEKLDILHEIIEYAEVVSYLEDYANLSAQQAIDAATSQRDARVASRAALNLSNITVTYGYIWKDQWNQTQRSVMKGPLNEQNYEAVRFWLNEIQVEVPGANLWGPGRWTEGFYIDYLSIPATNIQQRSWGAPTTYPGNKFEYFPGIFDSMAPIESSRSALPDDVSQSSSRKQITRRWKFIGDPAPSISGIGTGGPQPARQYEGFNHRIGVYYRGVDDLGGVDILAVFVPYISNTQYPPGANLEPDIYSYSVAVADHHGLPMNDTGQAALTRAELVYPSYYGWLNYVGSGVGGGAHPYSGETLYNDVAKALGDPTDILDNVTSARRWFRAHFVHQVEAFPYPSKNYYSFSPPTYGQVTAVWTSEPSLLDTGGTGAWADLSLSALQAMQAQADDQVALAQQALDDLIASTGAEIVASALASTLITNVKVGSRIAYYSPALLNSPNQNAETLEAFGEILSTAASNPTTNLLPWPQGPRIPQLGPFYSTRSGYIIKTANLEAEADVAASGGSSGVGRAAEGKYVFNVATSILEERVVLSSLASTPLSNAKKILWPAPTNPAQRTGETSAEYNARLADITIAYNNLLDGRTFSRDHMMEDFYGVLKKELYSGLAAQPDFDVLFRQSVGAEDMVAVLFVYGMMLTESQTVGQGPEHDFKTLFTDTKAALRTTLRTLLIDGDPCFCDPEMLSASDRAADAALGLALAGGQPFVEMGASFILKMLIETPLRILKGLAEVVDPHVIVGKTVRDVSGQVINLVEPYWPNLELPVPCPPPGVPDNPELRAQLTAAFGPGGPMEGFTQETFAGFLEFYIKELTSTMGVPEPLRPSASEKGIKITGTLPYLFALPPTPLGIAYILLDLLNSDIFSMAGPQEPSDIVCPQDSLAQSTFGTVSLLDCTLPPEPAPAPCDPECEPPEEAVEIVGCKPGKGPVTTCE
jgi:hypothetical protein